VYVTGWTTGDLGGTSAGGSDVFLAKYDVNGNLLWTCQLGTSGWENATGVAADAIGNVFISGDSNGSLAGPGSTGAYVAKYDQQG